MRIDADFPYTVTEHADLGIVMPDGCRLSARVWMPDGKSGETFPVVFEHLPYRKRDGTIVRDQYTHPWLAGHGYVCIRTDMRGNGDSQGLMADEYTAQELQDAVDVIGWAAEQPWCNGRVAMMGISWGGFNGLQVAALAPPALKAVISLCATADRYADDIHYKGGCLLGENFGWAANMLSYSSRPPDPEVVGDGWQDMWRDRLEAQPFHLPDWLRHPTRDAYWKHGSVCEDYGSISAAVLSIGGWHDGYRNTPLHLVRGLQSPVKAIIGPWIHKYPHYAGPAPAIGFLQEAKRWLDRWLKDIDTGVEADPAYRAYLMDSVPPSRWLDTRPGRWIAEDVWPSPAIRDHVFHATAAGGLSETSAGPVDGVVASPADCGACGGEYFPFAFGDELPDAQNADDAGSLCFDAAVATNTTDIVGAPRVVLRIVPEAQSGQIAVRLCDVAPDGTSALITYGVLNLTHHGSHSEPAPLVAGVAIDVEVTLDQIAYRLPAGHRLRLAVSSAYWPLIWPAPSAAELVLTAATLTFPVRPAAGPDEWSFEPPAGAAPWDHEVLRPAAFAREVTHDPKTGLSHTRVRYDAGENRDASHGLVSGGRMQEDWSIDPADPLSARVAADWEATGGRDGAMWKTRAQAKMSATRTEFVIAARLTAWLNGAVFFEKTFEDRIPRGHL